MFTTMAVKDGKVALYQRHCQRLIRDAERLGLPLDEQVIARRIGEEARLLGKGVLKLLISAGEGGRGYSRPEQVAPSLHFTHAGMPAHYAVQQQEGITVGCATLKLALQPALAGIKHLNRLEQVLIKSELLQQDVQDMLVLDASGHVAEATSANVFWFCDGKWFTPVLEGCGVHGVMRQFLIDWLTGNGQEVLQGNFSLNELAEAESVLLCNALMPLIPVRALHTREQRTNFSLTPVHDLFNAIQSTYREEYAPAN
ncbi:aminodeoxychorismate lyase [Alteromonas sp. H39]|uniref:aminodeoxychorismate lyase n=1 Tax=Alteromonas sp. H39 TaxID=3389876 RepID=UPI0039E0C71F